MYVEIIFPELLLVNHVHILSNNYCLIYYQQITDIKSNKIT